MLKKIGLVTAGVAAGLVMMSGFASAETADFPGLGESDSQVGLLNLNNLDLLHNVNANLGLCDNNVNVLGVQVPIHDSLNGIGVPILSPGSHEASGESPYNCAAGGLSDGGTSQGH